MSSSAAYAPAQRLPITASLRALAATPADLTLTLTRVTLGVVFFAHGAQKVLGWFGGFGLAGTMGYFTGALGLPTSVAALVIAAEFLGSLGLIAGLLGRVAAAGIIAVMLGAIVMAHAHFGVFMNWLGKQAGEGYEYHLLAIAMALAVVLRGSGALSLDRLLAARGARGAA